MERLWFLMTITSWNSKWHSAGYNETLSNFKEHYFRTNQHVTLKLVQLKGSLYRSNHTLFLGDLLLAPPEAATGGVL